MTSSQVALEFLLMLPMPWVINKIGARNGLIAYGVILALRILGSALVPNLTLIIVLRLLAGLEMPLLLISIMKYIAGAFDLRLYATVYAFPQTLLNKFLFSLYPLLPVLCMIK